MTAPATDPGTDLEAEDDKAPKAITARRLEVMRQIVSRLEKPELTTGDKIWIRDTLSAQIEAEL
jgi:hypothetical protein